MSREAIITRWMNGKIRPVFAEPTTMVFGSTDKRWRLLRFDDGHYLVVPAP